ncbi:pentapeptide repeat-containing protein [Gammaproteobacteria bacterium]|nr:pentapeptide repeat-containing protein [Gammaproteobacteria bacterium]
MNPQTKICSSWRLVASAYTTPFIYLLITYKASLTEVNLTFANLTNANLTGANLTNGNLNRANLSGQI